MLLADPASVTAEHKYHSGVVPHPGVGGVVVLSGGISDDSSSYVCTVCCFDTVHSPLKLAHHCDGTLKWNSRLPLGYVGRKIIHW